MFIICGLCSPQPILVTHSAEAHISGVYSVNSVHIYRALLNVMSGACWSLCTLCLLAWQMTVFREDSGLYSCAPLCCVPCVYSHARRQFSEGIQVCTVVPLCVMYLMFNCVLGGVCTVVPLCVMYLMFNCVLGGVCTVVPLCVMYLMFNCVLGGVCTVVPLCVMYLMFNCVLGGVCTVVPLCVMYLMFNCSIC